MLAKQRELRPEIWCGSALHTPAALSLCFPASFDGGELSDISRDLPGTCPTHMVVRRVHSGLSVAVPRQVITPTRTTPPRGCAQQPAHARTAVPPLLQAKRAPEQHAMEGHRQQAAAQQSAGASGELLPEADSTRSRRTRSGGGNNDSGRSSTAYASRHQQAEARRRERINNK
jgi:hypothetical protein